MIIKPGDKVRITNKDGIVRQGIVHSAYPNIRYKGCPPCWYIELMDEHFGAVYYKQDYDGGNVELLESNQESKV